MSSRILIKIGGRAFAGEPGFTELAAAIKSIRNLELIIVHGGGAEISQSLKDAKRETKFIDGIRVTRSDDIQIVEKVLSQTVNLRIAIGSTATALNAGDCRAKPILFFWLSHSNGADWIGAMSAK